MDLKSNEPFWLIKNGLLSSYPSLHEDLKCRVLIVGGGITGSLIAHQCISDGYDDTILIDRREVCNGSTSATTSMLQYEIDTPLSKLTQMIGEEGARASYKACSDAIDYLSKLSREINSESGFRKKESLYFAALKKDLPLLEKEFKARKDAGYKVEWLSGEQIKAEYELNAPHGGILSAQGGSVDAFRLAHELLAFNQKKGLRIFDKTALIGVVPGRKNNVCTVSTGQRITAERIIYCNGYESANLIPEKFVKLLSSYAIVSEVDPDLYARYHDLLIWDTASPYRYMRTTDDGRFLIGGEDEEFQNPEKRDALIGAKEKKLAKAFARLFPEKAFHSDFAWAGTFGETKDGLPYIGAHEKFRNAYFVLGFGGNGITFSVAGMEMVSAWLKGKPHLLAPYFAFGR